MIIKSYHDGRGRRGRGRRGGRGGCGGQGLLHSRFFLIFFVHIFYVFEGDDSNSKSPEKIRFFYVFATTGLVLSPFRLILCMSSLKPMYRHFGSTPGPLQPHQPEIASTSQVPILRIFQHVPMCSKMIKYGPVCINMSLHGQGP